MTTLKPPSFIKPGLDTPFRIDFVWWQNQDRNWRIFLLNYLCDDHRHFFAESSESTLIDRVDPETGEVTQVDGLQSVLMDHCAKQAGFLTENTTLVDSVFRYLLAQGNAPTTIRELGEKLNRPPETILRTLSSGTVYKGIKPALS